MRKEIDRLGVSWSLGFVCIFRVIELNSVERMRAME